jgi:phosphatidylserine/phosphatidylglycerophosphate/cardiolipin synthase-like enzyme
MANNSTIFSMDGLEVYFQSKRARFNAQLASRLVEFIEATEESLDCAIYDLRHPAVLDALVKIANNGKQLRIAFDTSGERSGGLMADPKPNGTRKALQDKGLINLATPVHNGRHLMHDKFLVRDGHYVWTGSANFTVGGLELQDNNCLIATSPELATLYTATFEEMLSPSHQHTSSVSRQVPTSVKVGQAVLTPTFSPAEGENLEQSIIAALTKAHKVRVLAFLISDQGILDALASCAQNPNVDIGGVYDPSGMDDVMRYRHNDTSSFWFMNDPRFVAAPSHSFNPRREQDFMHNKLLVIDDSLVITGSYNFSENAEANDENLIFIESAAVAAAFTGYFDELYVTYSGSSLARAA